MAGDTLKAGEKLTPGQKLVSANGLYDLIYQTDGNLVVYDREGRPLWASQTHNTPAGSAEMQTDGHFCLYNPQHKFAWGTGAYGFSNGKLVLGNDSIFMIYRGDGSVAWASGTATTQVGNLHFKKTKRKISFEKNGFPLDFHHIVGNRWQHFQDALRLPDADGKQYYMGTYSQNCSNNEGGMVFVAELAAGSTKGKVIWMDEMNNTHPAGGYNHPGDLRRIGNVVVIAAQNWDGTALSKIGVTFGADPMNKGAGNRQSVVFYDVSNPASPRYMGYMNSCWQGDKEIKVNGDVDTITASRCGDFYYLAFNGDQGIKCRSRMFTPDSRWEFIEANKDNGSSPVFYDFNGRHVAGGARVYNNQVIYDEIVDEKNRNFSSESKTTKRVDRLASPIPATSFPSGVTFSLSTLPNGKSYVVYANVESRSVIEIEEIESEDSGPIRDLFIAFGKNAKAPDGYNIVPVDLNKGAGGDDIYLYYTRNKTELDPVTSIQIVIGKNAPAPAGFQVVPTNLGPGVSGDLNKGAGGNFIYMFYSRSKTNRPIQMIEVGDREGYAAPLGWEKLPWDLNREARGNHLFLSFTRD